MASQLVGGNGAIGFLQMKNRFNIILFTGRIVQHS
jgi:hypothetical protein